jgi:hypothetical protein
MFGKSKPQTQPFPRHEFADRLDALLAAARGAGVSASSIADLLERRAESYAYSWRNTIERVEPQDRVQRPVLVPDANSLHPALRGNLGFAT